MADPAADAMWEELIGLELGVLDVTGRLEESCMDSKGFAVHPWRDDVYFEAEEYDPFMLPQPQFQHSPTVEYAQQEGYGYWGVPGGEPSEEEVAAEAEAKAERHTPFDDLPVEDKVAYYDALYGEGSGAANFPEADVASAPPAPYPPQGCAGEVNAALYPDDLDMIDPHEVKGMVVSRAVEIFADLEANVAASEEWAECMADQGFTNVDSPDDAADLFATRGDVPAELSAEQRDMAIADATCAERLDTTAKRNAAADDAARLAITEFEPQLVGLTDFYSTVQANADDALAAQDWSVD